jgi:universal stress protein E
MNKLNNILVGIDFSDCSRSALEQAVRLAKWNNVRLHALHSIEYLTLSDAAWASHIPQEKLEQDAIAEAKHTLHRWLSESKAPPETEVRVDVGSPIDCVLRGVRETKADLLVLGVNGSSMIPMGAGTLATKCLRKVPVKVMLVHERQTSPFRRIVVCVDFSDQSGEALTQAWRVAEQDQARFISFMSSPAHGAGMPSCPTRGKWAKPRPRNTGAGWNCACGSLWATRATAPPTSR